MSFAGGSDANRSSPESGSTPRSEPHNGSPARNRQRGYSLRSQLLSRSLEAGTQRHQRSSSIELSSGPSFKTNIPENDIQGEDRFTHRRKSHDTYTITPVDGIDVEEPTYIYADMVDNSNLASADRSSSSSKKSKKSKPGISSSSDILPNYSFWASKTVSRPQKIGRKLKHVVSTVQDYILQKKRPPKSVGGRTLPIKLTTADEGLELIDERTNKKYVPNTIVSSIYTAYNFLPRQLIFQFSKIANIYFLFVSILQMIPSWSTTGTYTTIIPLMVFMGISMGREGYDDWRRHTQDKAENSRHTRVIRLRSDYVRYSTRPSSSIFEDENSVLQEHLEPVASGDTTSHRVRSVFGHNEPSSPLHYKKVSWSNVKVGDILKLKQNDAIPADVIVLSSEGYGNTAYIETMDLDGETNLKARDSIPDLSAAVSDPESFAHLSDAFVTTEDPNIDLYNFEGTLKMNGKDYPLSSNNVVYRGSILRNTPSITALVVFTGEETKIRMNALQDPRAKSPKLQKKVNNIVVFMVCFVLGLSIFCTAASRIYWKDQGKNMWFLKGLEVGVVPNFMGFIIMLNTLIPLSLYVSLEIIKVSQMLLLQKDIDMYHAPSNTPCEAHTATINEELGQVNYIFSDKTGTLTDNVMLFRKLSVAGQAWLHDLDIQMEAAVADAHHLNHESVELANDVTMKRLFHNAKKTGSSSGLGDSSALTKTLSPTALRNSDVGSVHANRSSTDAIFRQVVSLPRKSSGIGLPRASMASLRRSTSAATHWKSNANPGKIQNISNTLQLLEYLLKNPHSAYSKKAKFFLLAMALCHTCVPDIEEESADNGPEIESLQYQASSPDELALLEAARDMGYLVIDRKNSSITIRSYPNGFDEDPVDEVYQVLEVIEFSSTRKRMSVVIAFPDGRICVFCKGADNVIMDRLRLSDVAKVKSEEISRQVSARKTAEAEIVIERNSLSSLGDGSFSHIPGKSSFGGGRPSLSGHSRASIDKRTALVSLDGYLQRAHNTEDMDMIAESSRQSFTVARQRKYGERPSRSSLETSHRRSVEVRRNKSMKSDHQQKEFEVPDMMHDTDDIQIDDHLALNDSYVIERTLQHVEEFSTEGLRTLLYGHRFLTKSEFDSWNKLYQDARTSLVDRQESIEKVGEIIEKDFDLTGATAIEDKLQDGVPDAIDKLMRAHIKIWMLTGDKRETAINIGYACRLIKDYSTVVVLRSDEGDVAAKMASAMVELDSGDRVAHCVVVVDGMTLAHIQEDMTLMSLFVDLGVKANSVICCRASPSQKAAMVMAVRKKLKKAITLAIGDGANDIAMIQSADVGIGITGKEGLQAARSSDYSIAQFRFLLKLLLVHGRWNYVRTCKYVLGTFYKEFLFFLTQAIYQRNTMFSGTSLYETWSLSMFNTLFTSLPVICLGIFEQDLSPTTLIAIPELYSVGQRNERFGLVLFISWMVVAATQSVGVSFLCCYLYGYNALVDNTLYPLGVIVFSSIIMIITTKLNLMEMHHITVINWAVVAISNGGWMCWCLFLSYIYEKSPSKIYFVGDAIFKSFGRDLSFWSTILILYGIAITFEFVIRFARMVFLPNDTDVFQELEKDPEIRYRLEKEAYSELKQGWEVRGDIESRLFSSEDSRDNTRRLSAGSSMFRRHDSVYSAGPSQGDVFDGQANVGRSAMAGSFNASPTRLTAISARTSSGGKKLLKKLPFSHRKTSEEYEREIFELLKKREQQINGS